MTYAGRAVSTGGIPTTLLVYVVDRVDDKP